MSNPLQPYGLYSPSGSSVHGILQARILEWVAISSPGGIFLIQGTNLHLLHWQVDSLLLSHQGRNHQTRAKQNRTKQNMKWVCTWWMKKCLTKLSLVKFGEDGVNQFDKNLLWKETEVQRNLELCSSSSPWFKHGFVWFFPLIPVTLLNLPGGSDDKVCLQCERPRLNPWVRKISWRRKWQPTLVFLPGKSHGWRSLVGSTWGCKESDMTERLHFHFLFTVLAHGGVVNITLKSSTWACTVERAWSYLPCVCTLLGSQQSSCNLSILAWVAITKCLRLGGLNYSHLFSHCSGGWEV